MGRPPRIGHGFKRLGGGAQIGALRKVVYACNGCGFQQATKPTQCPSCGRLDFVRFDSRAEIRRNGELELMQKAGLISQLERQRRFTLYAHGPEGRQVKVCDYVSDFCYMRDGEFVVEDCKGSAITDIAELKLKFFEAQFGFRVKLVKS